ncbi:transposase [Spirochaetia bacterium]|nr:transposase [Spirochaetia bacterium]
MELVKQGKQTVKAAGLKLKVGYRQAGRIYAAYQKRGDAGLIHGNVGKESNRKIKADTRWVVLQAYRERYEDFGPTFAAEKLAEIEGIKVSVSTVRRWLLEEGLWTRERRSSEYRSRRDRRESFGELIQFDGSHHRRFEGRGLKCCLITMIDDATNTRISQFFEEETTAGAMEVLSLWIGKYGIPQALYCDKKNAFVLTREPTDTELLKGITKPKSHFGKACGKLGIEVIAANSPQAKGRVERNHGLDQDRLVKELRLAGISTISDANTFLLETYLPKINAKFSKPAKSPKDTHIPLFKIDLKNIFCFEHERTVTNDYVVRFECRLFQLLKTNRRLPRPKDKVTLRIKLDNSCEIIWKDKPLLARELTSKKKEGTAA